MAKGPKTEKNPAGEQDEVAKLAAEIDKKQTKEERKAAAKAADQAAGEAPAPEPPRVALAAAPLVPYIYAGEHA